MGKVTFLDFFSGIGGFRMGFENAGMKCMGHVEWDKYAQQSYKAIYGDREGYGGEYCGWDIREVRAVDLPRVDVWTFGAPCQDFSIAGQRRGMDGDRSSLIREVFRLIEESEHKPEWLVYENVKGMLSSNRGWDFFGILFEMDRLWYDTEWQIFNSKDWGVPQNRERVYTIGHLRRCGGRKVLPIGSEHEAANELQGQYVGTLTTRTGASGTAGTYVTDGQGIPQGIEQVGQLYGTEREPKPQAGDGTITRRHSNMEEFIKWPSMNEVGYKKAYEGDGLILQRPWSVGSTVMSQCANTIRAGNPKDCGVVQNMRIRRLTPLECWRLQGFPDWSFYRAKEAGVSDSQLYKQAGNSVTVNVTEVIGRAIVE